MTHSMLDSLYEKITGDEDARVCKDIPESACAHLPRNYLAYLIANTLTKIADELTSARLVIPWLLSSLGAGASLVGFAVPLREAGVLIPQLWVAAYARRLAVRKWVWVLGAAMSAAMLLAMALASRWQGRNAALVILACLGGYALARGLCSVAAKDVLGKTVSKRRRGGLMGIATAVSSAAIVVLGLCLQFGTGEPDDSLLTLGLFASAAGLWLVAIISFVLIREQPGATEGGGNGGWVAVKNLGIVKSDPLFRRYLIGRIWLLSLALMPPFFVLAMESEMGMLDLGFLIIANGLAGTVSGVVWGRLSDKSSRMTMVLASLAGAAVAGLFFTWAVACTDCASWDWVPVLLFFLICVAHGGARLGRKTYLVDMANSDNRATYVAVSNTLIGLLMLCSGLVGVLAEALSVPIVILLLAATALLGAVYIHRIPNVSG